MSIWRWADWITPVAEKHRVTLGEGNTPLVRSTAIGPAEGLDNLWLKLEMGNPAGSFKDRFGAAAISAMRAEGQTRCIATSSGNTGSAVAAYTAAAGLSCEIAVVETAPAGKLKQMMAYGAHVYRIRGFGLDPAVSSQAFEVLTGQGDAPDARLQVSSYIYSIPGMTGVETISFELAEQAEQQCGSPVDHVFCQSGGGGLCLAVCRGYARLVSEGLLTVSPAIECVQPEGNDTMASALTAGATRATPVECTSQISGLQVPNINDGHLVVEELRPTDGKGHLVTDEAVWDMQKRLATEEGIFCEPAAATALAGCVEAARSGHIRRDATIVCLVTGSGFKDDASVDRMLADVECPTVELSSLESSAS